jgi:hypothetical protein
MYRQVQLLSEKPDEPVDVLDTHMENHMFGEYEIMAELPERRHTMECRGVVIAFFISASHVQHLCKTYPAFEAEMWRRSAVTALKVCSVGDFYNFRYESTRKIRIALQRGEISTPKMRKLEGQSTKSVQLRGPDDHMFFIRAKVRPPEKSSETKSKSRRKVEKRATAFPKAGESEHKKEDYTEAVEPEEFPRIVSGPQIIEVSGDDVVAIFHVKRRGDQQHARNVKAKMDQHTWQLAKRQVISRPSTAKLLSAEHRSGSSRGIGREAAAATMKEEEEKAKKKKKNIPALMRSVTAGDPGERQQGGDGAAVKSDRVAVKLVK